jgi:hypothetical protein
MGEKRLSALPRSSGIDFAVGATDGTDFQETSCSDSL